MPDAAALSPWVPPGGAHETVPVPRRVAAPDVRRPSPRGPAPPAVRRGGPALPAVVSAVLLAVLAATVVLLNVTATRGLSVFDEATHADYVVRVSEGELPADGDRLSQEVLGEWSCRGSASATLPLPPCSDGPYDAADFPAGGSQYNAAHPPLYYAVTALAAQAVAALTGDGLLEGARLAGILWLTSGLWVLLAALRRLGASWTLATAVATLVAVAPAVMHASSTVNNDASALLAGALVLWVGLRVLDGSSSWPAFAAVAVVVAALKIVFVVALIPAGLVLLLHLLRTPADRSRLLTALGAGAVAAVGAVLVWGSVQGDAGGVAFDNPVLGINTREADRVPVAATLKNLLAAWPPVGRAFVPTGLDQPQLFLWVALVPIVFASAPLLGLVAARRVAGRDVSIGAALGMVTVPVAVQMHTYVAEGYYFPNIAPRYGLCLVASLALSLAAAVAGRRRGELAVAVLAGLGTVAVVVALAVA